jgi:hypothetical protein
MTAQSDLDRTLGAWFGAEAAPAPPAEPLIRVLESTRGRRPWPSRVAGIGSHWIDGGAAQGVRGGIASLRPALVLALVALMAVALVGAALLVGSWLVAPAPPRIPHAYLDQLVQAPDLSRPMTFPVLVPLADGRVLVIGTGGDGGDPTTTAVLYDPATGASASAGPMVSAEALVVSSAVRLLDGRVLVIGDARPRDAAPFAVALVFDPTTMHFEPAGPMVTPRASAQLALLQDGRVVMTGGTTPVDVNTTLATAELFDPATSTFSATGSMGTSRTQHNATRLPDGRVFVSGGYTMFGADIGGMGVATAEVYDPRMGTFSPAGTLPFRSTVVIGLPDSRVAVLGGSSLLTSGRAAVWDLDSQTLSATFDGPEPIFGATLLDDGRILMTGGRPENWAAIYDPTTGAVAEITSPTAYRPSLARLADGRVLIVGGLTDGEIHGQSEAPAVPTIQIFQ